MKLPSYVVNPRLAFPEIASMVAEKCGTITTSKADRPISGLSLALACYLGTGRILNPPNITPEEFLAELSAAAMECCFPVERLFAWADSILLPPEATLSPGEADALPRRNVSLGFELFPYQIECAAWAARRMGACLAMGCGTGKTATAVAAAIAASRIGRCKPTRLFVVAPARAMKAWLEVKHDLLPAFGEVVLASIDSLHHYEGLSADPGGALIIDEAHAAKNDDRDRTKHAHALRSKFEWCAILTGTMLHSGVRGVLSLQDLAVPGSSRFISAWDFADSVKAVVTKKTAIGYRKEIMFPPEEMLPVVATYLARTTRSLSQTSPEVAAVVKLPGQEYLNIDEWERPNWVKDLQQEWADKNNNSVIDDSCPILWAPDTNYRKLLAATAVAVMNMWRDDIFAAAKTYNCYDADPVKSAANLGILVDDIMIEPAEAKRLRRLSKKSGLPIITEVIHHVLRLGRYDMVVAQHEDRMPNGTRQLTWRFRHRVPGEIHPGPKLKWVFDWLQDNPKEQAVIAADGTNTVELVRQHLEGKGISYRTIQGGDSVDSRVEAVDAFQASAARVMLMQQVAGSESANLTAAATSIIIDHNQGYTPYSQFLYRTNRTGQKRRCYHYDLIFGDLQQELIRKLRRGESFDASIRNRLENEMREVYQTINPQGMS